MSRNELQRIDPRECDIEHCQNVAHWQYNSTALCYEDMQAMSGINSDNAEVFATALDFFSAPDPERAEQILKQIFGDELPF